ncbi:MAG TPA: hypothetical protein VME86_16175 [Acidobacteriaceae bacterium]|nr:hypothetical protein [Acidobacteriaceae bacterium]
MKRPKYIAIAIFAAVLAASVAWSPELLLAASRAFLHTFERITDRLTETVQPHPECPLSQECI